MRPPLLLIVVTLLTQLGCSPPRVLTAAEISTATREELGNQWRWINSRHEYMFESFGEFKTRATYRFALQQRAASFFDGEIQGYVRNQQIQLNIPAEAVWWSWGPPARVDRTKTPTGTYETWYYPPHHYWWRTRVEFRDGLVTWWSVHDD